LFITCRIQIVFSEAWWVGTKEDNPQEQQLPLPPELAGPTAPHEQYDYDYGAGQHNPPKAAAAAGAQEAAGAGPSTPPASQLQPEASQPLDTQVGRMSA
jgi:hypothetical protein